MASSPPQDPREQPPKLGDRFVLQRCLGRGGFGVVYEAHDNERKLDVALKLLNRFDPTALYRFKREFRALADIVHPHLCTLYELISTGEQWFFTMELVRGCDLLAYVRGASDSSASSPSWSEGRAVVSTADGQTGSVPLAVALAPTGAAISLSADYAGATEPQVSVPTPVALAALNPALRPPPIEAPLPAGARGLTNLPLPPRTDWERLRQSLRQLASGLCYLHDAGKLHRDLKPQNLLVTPAGRLVILDFGLVRELMDEGFTLSNNAIAGTPAYMAPELVAGDPPTPASDWYSVGVIVYEALTGSLPFSGTWLEILSKKQREEPLPPSARCRDLPPDLEALCVDLLRRDPGARPSVRQVLRRLGSAAGARRPTSEIRSSPILPTPATTRPAQLPLVGRGEQLRALEAAFARTQDGQPVTVLLKGNSGMGKSALARHFLDRISHGEPPPWSTMVPVVLAGRCYQQESVPYKALDAVLDALSQHLKGLPQAQAQALLPRDIHTLARLFPVLLRVRAVACAPRDTAAPRSAAEVRRRAFAALRELLARLSDRQPLCVFIDDLQWGDVDSGLLLLDLLLGREPPAMLLLLSFRSEDEAQSPCLRALLPALRKGKSGAFPQELTVGELGEAEAQELALHLLRVAAGEVSAGSAVSGRLEPVDKAALASAVTPRADAVSPPSAERLSQAAAIARDSGGRPIFIDELVRDRAFGSPPSATTPRREPAGSLEAVILRRVALLPAAARRLLEVVAVAGQPVALSTALQAASQDGHAPTLGEQTLLRSGRLIRLREVRGREEVEVDHNRVREALVANLSPEALREAHRRLARALQAAGQGDPETLAQHLQAAGEAPSAARHAVTAAQQAVEALAFDRAARLYQLALALLPPDAQELSGVPVAALRVRLAEALKHAGRGAEAAQIFGQAAEAAQAKNRTAALWLWRSAAEQLLGSGHLDQGRTVLRRVLKEAGVYYPATPGRALVLFVVLRALLWLELRRRALLRRNNNGRRALPAAKVESAEALAQTASGAELPAGVAVPATEGGVVVASAPAVGSQGNPLLASGTWGGAIGEAPGVAALAPEAELLRRVDMCHSATNLIVSDTVMGAYFAMRQEALALRSGDPERLLRALAFEISLGAMTGGDGAAGAKTPRRERWVQQELDLLAPTARPQVQGVVRFHTGVAQVLRGQWQQGLLELRRALTLLREQGMNFSWELASAQHFALLCLGLLGRWREIRERLPGIVADARHRGDRFAETTALSRVGQIPWLMQDRPAEARDEVQNAVSAWSRDGFYLQHYFGLISLGEVALYQDSGAGPGALELVKAQWRALEGSHLLRTQAMRSDVLFLRGRGALALAATLPAGRERARVLGEAAADAARLARERPPWIAAFAAILQAGVAAQRGEDQRALAALESAAESATTAAMPLYAAAARYHRGLLLGGESGRALQSTAEALARAEGVKLPGRLFAMMVPGLRAR